MKVCCDWGEKRPATTVGARLSLAALDSRWQSCLAFKADFFANRRKVHKSRVFLVPLSRRQDSNDTTVSRGAVQRRLNFIRLQF